MDVVAASEIDRLAREVERLRAENTRLNQCAGRVVRAMAGIDTAEVDDYHDRAVPILAASFAAPHARPPRPRLRSDIGAVLFSDTRSSAMIQPVAGRIAMRSSPSTVPTLIWGRFDRRPKQGYHVTLDVDVKGAGQKHKIFWLDCPKPPKHKCPPKDW